VTLSSEERQELEKLVSTGRHAAQTLTHARILLQADEAQGSRRSDAEISESLAVNHATVERTRQALVEEGLHAALYRKPRTRPGHVKFDGQKEAQLLAVACSPAPAGHRRGTLQLLADKMVELHVFESISPETVRQVLKKPTQAVAEAAVVHPAGVQCRVCLRDGGGVGRLPAAGESATAAGVYG
jgi:hypothetical protein